MADSDTSADDKTLPPSGKRLGDARNAGDVPRSRELSHLMMMGASVAALSTLAGPLMDACVRVVRGGLTFDATLAREPARMGERFWSQVADALVGGAPLVAILIMAAVAAPLLIGGWVFAPKLMPDLARLDPVAGLGRLISIDPWLNLGKSALLLLLLGSIAAGYLSSHVQDFAALARGGLQDGIARLGSMVLAAFAMLVLAIAVLAAVDVPLQLYRYNKKLMMTPEEAKREGKDLEGDPAIKGRIKARAREIARKRMMAAVPKADVVVTNPTHFAVALKYLEGRHRAPVVVAKGIDAVAQKIRAIADEHQVPLLEAPPLARALYQHVEIGDEIPTALYTAVAQVLAYVFQLRRHAQGAAARPVMPTDLDVPAELDPLAPRATA